MQLTRAQRRNIRKRIMAKHKVKYHPKYFSCHRQMAENAVVRDALAECYAEIERLQAKS